MPAKLTLVHDADRIPPSRNPVPAPAIAPVLAYEDLFDLSEPQSSIDSVPVAQSLGGDLLLLTHRTGAGTTNWMDKSNLAWTALGNGYHHRIGEDALIPVVRGTYHVMKAPEEPGHFFVVVSRASDLIASTVLRMPVSHHARRLASLPRAARSAETFRPDGIALVALLMWLHDHGSDPGLGYMPSSAQILACLGDADLIRFWGATLCGGEAQRTLFQDRCIWSAGDLGRLWTEGWSDAGR